MVKEIERAGIPVVHMCTVTPISMTVGANRIVPTIASPHPLGNPALSREEEKAIRRKLVELSRSGIAVLLVSADLNEVMELSDSLIVMYGGKIAAYFEDTDALNDEIMGEYMLGLQHQPSEQIGRVCHE